MKDIEINKFMAKWASHDVDFGCERLAWLREAISIAVNVVDKAELAHDVVRSSIYEECVVEERKAA